MELNKGYIHTEVGFIPEDWHLKTIVQIAKYNDAGIKIGPFGSALKKELLVKKGFKVYGQENIFENDLSIGDRYIKKSHFQKLKSCELHSGDFIISMMGTIGKSMIVPENFEKGIMDSHLIRIRIDDDISYKDYFKHYFSFTTTLRQIKSLSVGGIMEGLSSKIIKKVFIPLPSTLKEQKAIAQVLTDTDQLIQNLKTLISKKKAIKKGAMQELLTPDVNWQTKTILELADNKKELFDDGDWIEAEHITDKGIRLIQTGNIGKGRYVEKTNKKYIFEDSYSKLNCKPLKQGDILICRLAEPAGRACLFPDINEAKVITSVDVTIFRPRKEVANRVFLVNIFSTSEWFSAINESVGGTTHKRISRGSLGKIEIKIPSISKQNKIAEILSDMDLEIQALQIQLQKTQNLKQGMMQELLTGKIRLVNPVSQSTKNDNKSISMAAEPEVNYNVKSN